MTTPSIPPIPPVISGTTIVAGDSRVTILNVTGPLQSVPQTVRIDGQVTQQNSDGSVVISTSHGDVTAIIRGSQSVVEGQTVELDIQAGQPPRQAVLRPVDPSVASAPTAPTSSTPSSQPTGAPVSVGDDAVPTTSHAIAALPAQETTLSETTAPPLTFPLRPGQPVRLLPLPPGTEILPSPSAATPGVAPKGPLSQLLQILDADGMSSARPDNPSTHAGTANVKAATSPLSGIGKWVQDVTGRFLKPSATPAGQSDERLTPAPVSPRTAHIDAVVKSLGDSEPAFPFMADEPTGKDTITGKIAGFTRQGLPVISLTKPGDAAPQDLILQFKASNLTLDSTVKLTLIPEDAALAHAIPPLGDDLGFSAWPALQSLTDAGQDAPALQHMLAQTLPNPSTPAHLPPAALLYIASIQSGDIENWLGPKAIDLLRRAGKAELVERLAGDIATAGKSSAQPVAQDWKALPMPLIYDGQIDKATIWFRHDREPDDEDGTVKGRQTRFIFDLDLTRMGAVQLDGLAKSQRIDLIVRTLKPVGDAMRGIMREKYMNALEHIEFTGDLSFQDKEMQFVKISTKKNEQSFEV